MNDPADEESSRDWPTATVGTKNRAYYRMRDGRSPLSSPADEAATRRWMKATTDTEISGCCQPQGGKSPDQGTHLGQLEQGVHGAAESSGIGTGHETWSAKTEEGANQLQNGFVLRGANVTTFRKGWLRQQEAKMVLA
jgi:hypothetical protein